MIRFQVITLHTISVLFDIYFDESHGPSIGQDKKLWTPSMADRVRFRFLNSNREDHPSFDLHLILLLQNFSDYTICPYGHLSWIIPVLAIFGMLFFVSAAFGCSLTISRSAYHEVYIGYWFRESTGFAISNGEEGDGNICVTWQDTGSLFDGLWRFGKSVGVLGGFTTILPALFDLILLYRRLEQQWFPPLIVIHFGNAMMCLLLLCGLESAVCKSELCEMARGGVIAIFASLFWIAAGICLLCLLRRERQLLVEDEEEPQEEFLALPAAEQAHREYPALPANEKARKKQEKFPALPPAQDLESDSDDENEVYNDDLKALGYSEKSKKKEKLKELPPSESSKKKKKKSKK